MMMESELMTPNEHYIMRTEGVEMAAAYRKGCKIAGKAMESLEKNFVYNWEKACKDLIGEDKYKAGRSERYKDLIREMKEEE